MMETAEKHTTINRRPHPDFVALDKGSSAATRHDLTIGQQDWILQEAFKDKLITHKTFQSLTRRFAEIVLSCSAAWIVRQH